MYELKEDLDNHFENEHTPEEKASSIVIINSENVITIPGIATVADEGQGLVLHELAWSRRSICQYKYKLQLS